MVVDGAQVEQMLLGENGAASGARRDTLFIDMSTIAPRTARELGRDACAERGTRSSTRP